VLKILSPREHGGGALALGVCVWNSKLDTAHGQEWFVIQFLATYGVDYGVFGGCTVNVRVYRNLHKVSPVGGPVYSVQSRVNGGSSWRVVCHSSFLVLVGGWFRVMESGRRRTVCSGQKCVHAFVYGELLPSDLYPVVSEDGSLILGGGVMVPAIGVSYNPYRGSSFYSRVDGSSVSGVVGRYVVIGSGGVFLYI
jgi:hypothetical protein